MSEAALAVPRGVGRRVFEYLEYSLDWPGGAELNPLRHLGALGFLFFWLIAASGIYLYVVLEPSATGAYLSIDQLSREQWFLGGILRSVHRYAADGLVLVTLMHLLREWVFGRYAGFRWFSWLTGLPLIGFVFACGIGGFWLNWDQLGQFSAQATAEWFDGLPFFASPLTRNFLTDTAVSDRLFSLFVFVHLGLPLLMLFVLWLHVQRISLAQILPPRRLTGAVLVSLLALSVALPVLSQPAADLAVMPTRLAMDWFVLFVHPLMIATSPQFVWAMVLAGLMLLSLLPFVSRKPRAPAAVVTPQWCNGCRRCVADCPYAAITMAPHPLRHARRELAVVDGDLCAGCGICVGSCPSSTPFRGVEELVTGIDLPQSPISALRKALHADLTQSDARHKLVVFGCDHGADVRILRSHDVITHSLACAGMLPPSFVEYALRDGAAGVLVATCRQGGCEFRRGEQWTMHRLQGSREPHLRSAVDSRRWAVVGSGLGDDKMLQNALARLRERVIVLETQTSIT